jgi:hypothetical protein
VIVCWPRPGLALWGLRILPPLLIPSSSFRFDLSGQSIRKDDDLGCPSGAPIRIRPQAGVGIRPDGDGCVTVAVSGDRPGFSPDRCRRPGARRTASAQVFPQERPGREFTVHRHAAIIPRVARRRGTENGRSSPSTGYRKSLWPPLKRPRRVRSIAAAASNFCYLKMPFCTFPSRPRCFIALSSA